MQNKVLTVTMNPSVDIGTQAEKVITNQKTRCAVPVVDPGGGGVNVARVLSRLGISCDALFISGGYTGNLLKEMMAKEKVPVLPVESSDNTRQNISIIENQSGEQYRFVLPGMVSESSVWEEVLQKVKASVQRYDFVIGSGSLPDGVPVDFYSRLSAIASNAGKAFVLDTSGPALWEGLHSGAAYIKPNQEEFAELKAIYGAGSDEALCRLLFEKGVKNIIHTLGKERTVLISEQGTFSYTPPSIEVRSSIGAGDSFVGGMIAGLIQGLPEQKAVAYGISTAASTLQSEGTDLCDVNEVKAIFARHFNG